MKPGLTSVLLASCVAAAPIAAADVQFFDLFYSTFYNQTSGSAPTDYDDSNFSARIIATPGDVGFARVLTPDLQDLSLPEIGPGYFLFQQDFSTQEDSLFAFGPGDYIFGIQDGTLGDQAGEIMRPDGSFWSEEIPAFTESCFWQMQSADAASDLTLEFNTFAAPAPANTSLIFVFIYDEFGAVVFNDYFESSIGTEVIPGGTLDQGRHYSVLLYFSSRIENLTAEFGGSAKILGFDRVTIAPLVTVATCPADLNHDGFVDDLDFVFFVVAYNILDCADPAMPQWCPADLTLDGVVEDSDFVLFVGAYNELLCP
ncbi:MAG: hypothetical protein KF691_03195 [Phycisphaeraceae bacterium]|nr:hypothetical protein [Phycisphaeraceae bacterium]